MPSPTFLTICGHGVILDSIADHLDEQSNDLHDFELSSREIKASLAKRMVYHNGNRQFETLRIRAVHRPVEQSTHLNHGDLENAFGNDHRPRYVRRIIVECADVPTWTVALVGGDPRPPTWKETKSAMLKSLVANAYGSARGSKCAAKIREVMRRPNWVPEQPEKHGFLLSCLLMAIFPKAVMLSQELGQEWGNFPHSIDSKHLLSAPGLNTARWNPYSLPLLAARFPMMRHFAGLTELSVVSKGSSDADVESFTWLPYLQRLRRLTIRGPLTALVLTSDLWRPGATLPVECLTIEATDDATGRALSLLLYGMPALRDLRVEVSPTDMPVHDTVNAALANARRLESFTCTLSRDRPEMERDQGFRRTPPGRHFTREPPRFADLPHLRYLTVDLQLLHGNESATPDIQADCIRGHAMQDITLVLPETVQMMQKAAELVHSIAYMGPIDIVLLTRQGRDLTRRAGVANVASRGV